MPILKLSLLVVTLNLEIAIVSLNIGTRLRRFSSLFALTVIFALFHCIFSLAGFCAGNAINGLFGEVSRYLSAAVLILVGFRILRTSLKRSSGGIDQSNILLILLGAGIEDFAGGISVGTGAFGGGAGLLILLFFAISVPVNFLSFRLGRAVSKAPGVSVDFLSGLLLISLGILSAFDIF